MNEKVILVSGGSRGLGEAIVIDLLNHGYKVASFSRSGSASIAALQDSAEGNFLWAEVDATDAGAMKAFVLQVYRQFGRIDGLINNAGATYEQLLSLSADRETAGLIELNLKSVIQLTRAVVRIMLQQAGGVITNISSIVGLRGYKGTSVYSATKAALDGFSRSLARELGGRGIRINSVAPGFMATRMTENMPEQRKNQIIRRTPLGRLGKVEDIVGIVRFLLTPEAEFITGQTLVVDGGLTC